jgi:peptide-methionine (S)-S-oxide reductase
MESPNIGRILAIAAILTFVGWNVVRIAGARPAETPNAAMFPKPAVDEPLAAGKAKAEKAVFAGGCFWGVQAVFEHVKGVNSATSGYSGGKTKNPSYEGVSTGMTGHAESVEVSYDPSKITYGQLLMVYFSVVHDPTQLNRQGPDTGTQYRSSIFYVDEQQKKIAEAYVAQLEAAKIYSRPIVTKIVAYDAFYKAEEYHQDYAKNNPDNPYIVMCDAPKMSRLKKEFPGLYKAD